MFAHAAGSDAFSDCYGARDIAAANLSSISAVRPRRLHLHLTSSSLVDQQCTPDTDSSDGRAVMAATAFDQLRGADGQHCSG